VQIPEYTDAKGKVHAAQRNRINYAFNEGGPQLLVRTVQDLTGVRVDHYLQVDFEGFQSMVDKLGGVDVCLSKPAKDHYSGINLTAGRHHINGVVALAFVRQRHGLTNGDIDRIKRQQQFLGAMIRKVLSAGTLANPFKLNGFLNVATSSLKADEGLDFATLRTLALRMRSVGAGNVIFATIPISNSNAYLRGLGSVVLVDQEKADALFLSIQQDIPPGTPAAKPTTAAGAAPLIVRPGAIRVHVYNGSDVNGLGRRADRELTDLGFQTVGTPESRGTGATGTVVRYGSTKSDSARTVAAAIPGATLEAAPELGNVIEVVVGSSYPGAQAVTVTASKPAAAPSAAATPKVVTALDDPCAP
jgi:LCP family protein required for cell wall assembly